MYKKYVPNTLTILRMVLSLILIPVTNFTHGFYFLYIVIIISDLLDGYFARKFNCSTVAGAKLDSSADFLFTIILLIKLYPDMNLNVRIVITVALIAVLRLISAFTAFIKFKSFVLLHTYLNKLTGILTVIYPLLMKTDNILIFTYVVIIIAMISSVEELMIEIKSTRLNLDIKGLWKLK